MRTPSGQEIRIIDLGIILLLIAVMDPELAPLWGVGLIALLVGMVLAVCGAGRGVASRRHYLSLRERSMISPRRPRRHEARSQRAGEERSRPGAPRTVNS